MALTKNQQTIQDIYGTHLGRQAATEGLDYWSEKLDKGGSIEDVIRGIQSGSEYKGRQGLITSFGEANDGSKPSEAYLDARLSPGGGVLDPNAKIGHEAPTFAADNTWSSPLMTKGNNTWTDELTNIYKDLEIGGASTTGSPHFNTLAAANTGNYNVGVTHDAAGNPITNTGTGDTGTGTGNIDLTPSGGTADSPKPWYDGYGSGEEWLAANPQDTGTGDSGNSGDGMGDFMKFMMFMSMMRPYGMGGGSQYGYGGLNPGGVQSAYNPMDNMQGMMDSFKSLNSGLLN
jgi:hypothetical protein